MIPYVELHCHSGYSFLDGASHTEELVLRAKELGYPALALTDHDGLYGAMEFAQHARMEGIQPITGVEITLEDGTGLPREARVRLNERGGLERSAAGSLGPEGPAGSDGSGSSRARTDIPPQREPGPGTAAVHRPHVTVLAETPTGYAGLCRLLTESRANDRRDPWLPLSSLQGRTQGLILLTGCANSPLARALEDSVATGEAFLAELLRTFGPEHLFVELQVNHVKGEAARNRGLARLADRFGVPVVATGNVHYHKPERHHLQDVLVAIRHRTTLDGAHDVRRPNNTFYLAAADEMAWRFRGREDAIENTLRIAERCAAFDLTEDLGYCFPDFEGSGRGTAAQVLSEVCQAAVEERYPLGSKHRTEALERLASELDLVERHMLSGFFLVYRDIFNLARKVAAEIRGNAPRAFSGLPPAEAGDLRCLPSSAT